MAPADDLKEEVDGALVDGHISEFVADQKIDVGIALHASLDGGQRLLFQEIGERRNDRGKANGHTGGEGGEAYVLREHRLAHATGAAKKNVLAALHEAEAEDVLAQGAVDPAWMAPVETVHRGVRAYRRHLGAGGEIARLALPALHFDQQLDDLHVREAVGGGVRQQGLDLLARRAEADAPELVDDVAHDCPRFRS